MMQWALAISVAINVLLFLALAGHVIAVRELQDELDHMRLDEATRKGRTVLNAILSQRN